MSIVLLGSTSGSCTLQEQAIAGTTTLTLPTTSGTVLTSASSVARSQLPAGSVLQVISTFKNDVFSAVLSATSGGAFTDITGFSVSITPTTATSRILVLANFGISTGTGALTARLVRNSTVISNGIVSGSRVSASIPSVSNAGDTNRGVPASINFLDSPETTSSVTYKLQIGLAEPGGTYTAYFNTSGADGDFGYTSRMGSSITVMEIAA